MAQRQSARHDNDAVRTHGGFCWAAFTNARRANSQMDGDLDKLNWDMVGQVDSWRVA